MHHGLSSVAAEGVSKLGHVGDDVVDSVAAERMSLRHHGGASSFRTEFTAPHVGVRQEEILQLAETVGRHGVKVHVLSFE